MDGALFPRGGKMELSKAEIAEISARAERDALFAVCTSPFVAPAAGSRSTHVHSSQFDSSLASPY